jgi:hypothetical protein
MLEVAQTVADVGIEPMLSNAIAERQAWAGTQGGQVMGGENEPLSLSLAG